jgi:hypothetical protein
MVIGYMEICMRKQLSSLAFAPFLVCLIYCEYDRSFKLYFLESLQVRLGMEPYSDAAAQLFKLNSSDDWLQKWQGLALPALPPTTLEACRYFVSKI